MFGRPPLLLLAFHFLLLPSLALADTQEVVYTNRVAVYVGDLVNEADATLEQRNAGPLCARLNTAIEGSDKPSAHVLNCIFHIVRLNDLTDVTQVQTPDVQHWYTYSDDPTHGFWSLEDLSQNKRLFGASHVSFFFILINRAFASSATNVTISSNALTIAAPNNFSAGQTVTLSGFKTAAFLNGQTAKVASATSTQFTATFSHADYASATDTGYVIFRAGEPTPPPTPGPAPTETSCDSVSPLPPAGGDGYYASYKIDVTRKVSANIQHLMSLLGAAGLKNPTEVTTSPSVSTAQSLLAIHRNGIYKNKCQKPDAIFGGGTIDVAYRPSDIAITSSMATGVGGHQVIVSLDRDVYTVDNEGRYYVDFSVPVGVKKLSGVQYQPTGSTFTPVDLSSSTVWFAADFFIPASDVKSQNWTRYPHPLTGIAFAKQPLHNILLAGAWGPSFSEVYMGLAWVKQPRIAPGSDSCDATSGAATGSPNPYGYHFCRQFTIGLNMAITAISNKLGAPR